jgi:glycosyltransferase involved in cell wall biosynthesis
LNDWQAAHKWVITDADRVICPSHDIANRFQRQFTDLRPIIAAHPEKQKPARTVKPAPLTEGSKLRIAVLGDFLKHKGSETVLECAKIVRAESDPLLFDLIGDPSGETTALSTAGVRFSGRYKEPEIDSLIAQRQPHLFWYPARSPETYCYTLSVGLNTGLPVVVANLGALPERVAGRAWSWICPWDWAPLEWVAFFLDIRATHFLPMIPPSPPGSAVINSNHRFYEHQYLAPVMPNVVRPDPKLVLAMKKQSSAI